MTIDDVIENGNCIGCGACAFLAPDHFAIRRSPEGHCVAERLAPGGPVGAAQCPMSGAAADETEIATGLWPHLPWDGAIGRYLDVSAGSVKETPYREQGGSGGIISWLLCELLDRQLVDAVLHVRPTGQGGDAPLFAYAVSSSCDEVRLGAKSRYYPVEMSQVLPLLTRENKRFAVVGLPCFIKAIRMLQRQEAPGMENVAFAIGLICGHLKSAWFADYLAAQVGGQSGRLTAFDFRRKLPGRPASKYGFAFRDETMPLGEEIVRPMHSVKGYDWGEGLFKNPACEYCDDVFAECADVVVGDAWIPKYISDWQGTSVIVARDKRIGDLLSAGIREGRLELEPLTVEDAVGSQRPGLVHRREGTAHRLARRIGRGQWVPRKRVEPALAPKPLYRVIFDLREKLAVHSAAEYARAIRKGRGYKYFERRIAPLIYRYKAALKLRNYVQKHLSRLVR